MKIKPSNTPGSVVMELDDRDSDRLSKPANASAFKLNTILVPVDFSNCSKKALQYAVPFAKQFNATIIFLHVVPSLSGVSEEPYQALILQGGLRKHAAQKMKELAEEFVPRDIQVKIETCLGATGVEIAGEAKKLEADLIVISTHGRTGRAHSLAGSVAENLVQLAPCPVLVVREHEHEFIEGEAVNLLSNPPNDD